MVSTIKKRGSRYYCSNCQMGLSEIRPNCLFCGNWFSNAESLMFQEAQERENAEIKKEDKYESNLSGKN